MSISSMGWGKMQGKEQYRRWSLLRTFFVDVRYFDHVLDRCWVSLLFVSVVIHFRVWSSQAKGAWVHMMIGDTSVAIGPAWPLRRRAPGKRHIAKVWLFNHEHRFRVRWYGVG
jgi:hypothetical protein